MKQKQQTREELVARIAVLETDYKELLNRSEWRKGELSKVLGAGFTKGRWEIENEQIVYSWEQIVAEVGKLLAKQTQFDFIGTAERLADDITTLRFEIEHLKTQP